MARNIGVILAGGSGVRVGADVPKQFLTFAGKTVLEHTVEVFERYPGIDEIAIVSKKEFIPEVEEFVRKNGWKKVRHILSGGKERYDSTLAAVAVYEDSYRACCTAKRAGFYTVGVYDRNSEHHWDEMCLLCDETVRDWNEAVDSIQSWDDEELYD